MSPLWGKCAARRRWYPLWRHRSDVTTVPGGLGSTFKVTSVKRRLTCFYCVNLRPGANIGNVRECGAAFRNAGAAVIAETVHEWGRSVCVFIFCVRSGLGCSHVEYDRLLLVLVLRMPSCTWRIFAPPVSNFIYWLFRVHILYYPQTMACENHGVYFCCWSPM